MRPEKGEVAMAKVIVRYTDGDEDEHEVMDLRVSSRPSRAPAATAWSAQLRVDEPPFPHEPLTREPRRRIVHGFHRRRGRGDERR